LAVTQCQLALSAINFMLTQETLRFLSDLGQNNNRDWFHENRPRYEKAKKEFENLVAKLIQKVGELQELGSTQPKDCIFRINRDIRFSKNKAPYKQWLSAAIGPGGRRSGRVDYYLHIQPGNESFLGAGMWNPTPAQLAKYRQEIDYNASELKEIIHQDDFRAFFPTIEGEVMKTAPKGYGKEHPEIELLRRKQLFFMHHFTDREVLSERFLAEIMRGVALIKPYCDFLNYIFLDEKEGGEPVL
jgi:uncharacterized protein (TIGR02453 family)